MLIGAHVSPAGGLPKAIERGEALGCEAIQIFGSSPRQWAPLLRGEEEIEGFKEAMATSSVKAVVIHAIYLLNCASTDRSMRRKSLVSLTHSLRLGASIGARGVILHPGSAKTGRVPAAIVRAGRTIAAALADSEACPLLLENTAGAGGTLGRSIEELRELIEASGGGSRLGVCLDSAHLFASGYDIRSNAGMEEVLALVGRCVGIERVGALHLNDSQAGLGSNRDRHANVGEGELGDAGCAAFLAPDVFSELPCVLETAGEGSGPTAREVARAVKLRREGLGHRKAR
jgi:deoxyribonuclease-4